MQEYDRRVSARIRRIPSRKPEPGRSKKPATAATLQVMEAAREHHILIGRGGLYGNVIRLSPPMNIAKTDVDAFVEQLDSVFAHVTAPAGR